MKRIIFFLFFVLNLSNLIGQTSYTYSTTLTNTTATDYSCGGYNYNGDDMIKLEVGTQGSDYGRFRIVKASGTFSKSGTAYIKQDDICGTIVGQVTYAAGASTSSYMTVNYNHTTSYVNFYGVIIGNDALSTRYRTLQVKVTATTITVDAPTNSSPSDGAVLDHTTSSVDFKWTKNNSSGKANYEIKINDLTTNTVKVDYRNVNDVSSYTWTGVEAGHEYRWVVRAVSTSNSSVTAQSSSTTFSLNAAPDLRLTGSMGFGSTTLYTGQSYAYSATIKNYTSSSWSGPLFLKDAASNNVITIQSVTIPANSSKSISGSWTPSTQGSYSLTLYYQTGGVGAGSVVTPNGYSNPFSVNVLAPLGQPTPASPANSLTYTSPPSSITYQWTKNNGTGVTYRLKVRDITTGDTGPLVFDQNVGDVSSYSPTRIYTAGNTYRWVVIAERGTETNDSPAHTFSIANAPANIMLASSAAFSNTAMIVGQSYTYTVNVKNTGGTSWTGNFFVKQGLGTGYADEITFSNKTIGVGQTITLSGTYTPQTAGTNLNMTLYMTGNVAVPASGFANTVVVNIIAPLGQPTLLSPTNSQIYTSVPSSITYQWTKNNGIGVTYRLKVRDITTGDTGPLVFDQNVGDVPSYTPTRIYTAGNTYRWVVIAERGTSTNDSPAYTFSIANAPANIMLAGSAAFSSTNMQVGQSYPYSVKVKNTGGTSWTGNFFLKTALGATTNELEFWSQTIAPGQTITLNGTYTPQSAASNLNLTLYMTGSVAVPTNGFTNTLTVNIVAENTNLALAAQMGYFNSSGTKVSNLNIAEAYTFKASIKNNGNASKSFAFFLKKAQGVTSVYDLTMSPYTIAPGQTVEISKAFTPAAAEQNVSLSLFYQINGGTGSTLVTPGSFSNPISVSVLSSVIGTCDLSGVSPTSAYYAATANLCSKNILSGNTNTGAINVTDTLKRAHLAKIAINGLYMSNGRSLPATLPSDNFPMLYDDLDASLTTKPYYYQAAKALLYLEYGDGISPFDRNKTNFNPDNFVARVDVLKVLMETFNIKPDITNTNNPYPTDNDAISLMTNNPLKFGYIRKAASLGFITLPSGENNKYFRPFANCLRGEAFVILDRIITWAESNTANNPNPTASSYFTPLNITLENLAMGLSLHQGNFNHYTKTSFSIDGVVPLGFAHTYNSYVTDLPDDFYSVNDLGKGKTETYKPLGSGWSHSYHSFATAVEDKLVVHWGGGQIDVYRLENAVWKPMSIGVYDEATIANSILTVKTKSQIRYLFKRQSTSGPAILQLYSVIDRNGNTLKINYTTGQNGLMVISSVSDDKRQLNFSYKSGTNMLEKVIDPLGRYIKFNYVFNSILNEYQLSSFEDANFQNTNKATIYTYGTSADLNKCKLLEKIQLPKGNYIQNEYEANRRLSKTVTGKDGIPKTQTAVSVNTNYQTNALTSKVDVSRAGTTSSYNYTFNKNNSTTGITGSGNLNVSASYGNSTRTELPTAVQSNSTNISDIQYDSKGNATSITKKSLLTAETQVISMAYNAMNDITSYKDPKGNITNYDYDTKGNLIKIRTPESTTTNIAVDPNNGLPTQTVNPEGVAINMAYNQYGNLNSVKIPSLNLTSTMVYDNASRMTSTTNFKGLETSFAYDLNDNLVTETKPMNHITTYAYDVNDNLITIKNAKGVETSMTYDNATDWLTAVTFGGLSKKYIYNQDGTLQSFTKPDNITVLNSTYDNLGRVLSDGINSYTYDANLRLSTITKINGKTLTYTYDGFNRVTAVDYNDFANNKVQYGYDANGNITSMTYPGGKKVIYTYDGLNRMTSVLADWVSKKINYTYRKDDLLQSVSYPNGMTTTFTYDAAGRQTAKTTTRSNGITIAGYSFVLDNIGNITQETKSEPYQDIPLKAETTNYSYNTANRIQTAGTTDFKFDNNGNTTDRGTLKYTWDASDKITSGDGLTYEYDGLGNRRAAGTKRYMMDIMGMGNVLAECDASGNPTAYYLHGLGLEARILPNSTIEYYVSDYRGSTVAMVDESANITHKYQYDEFGNIAQQQETDYNPFRYVGKYGVMYENDHLVYMRARYYDPTIGRFMSEDPIWSTNLYPYGDNNPFSMIDPSGNISTSAKCEDTGMQQECKANITLYSTPKDIVKVGTVSAKTNFDPSKTTAFTKVSAKAVEIKGADFKPNNNYSSNISATIGSASATAGVTNGYVEAKATAKAFSVEAEHTFRLNIFGALKITGGLSAGSIGAGITIGTKSEFEVHLGVGFKLGFEFVSNK
jgi:RHS repeat-associated protein